jgi:(p)ppGpp synthase/HD superfamily hydrolase
MHRVIEACAYAARKHQHQRRKGVAGEPYVNHLIDVAARVSRSAAADDDLLIAALLHDVIEDTDGTAEEISALFGPEVARVVLEVTDDKSLPKAERKARQEAEVAHKSVSAKRIKLADKASNLAALAESPPSHWDRARVLAYIDWADRVISGARNVDPALEAAFDASLELARRSLVVEG